VSAIFDHGDWKKMKDGTLRRSFHQCRTGCTSASVLHRELSLTDRRQSLGQ